MCRWKEKEARTFTYAWSLTLGSEDSLLYKSYAKPARCGHGLVETIEEKMTTVEDDAQVWGL